MPSPSACSSCKFANLIHRPGVDRVQLQCRRYPPAPVFPIVDDSGWCGEFQTDSVAVPISIKPDAPTYAEVAQQVKEKLEQHNESVSKVRNKRSGLPLHANQDKPK